MKDIIGCYIIGGSSTVIEDRRIGWNIKAEGWRGFVDRWVKPAIEMGFKRLELHNPGGTLGTEVMQADQFIHARNAGLDWILDDFIEVWKPITASGIEVISYLGDIKDDNDFKKRAAGTYSKDDWFRRIEQSYNLPLNAGMSIGFDALSEVGPDSTEYLFVKLIQSMGVKVYIEPFPHHDYPNLFPLNALTTQSLRDAWSSWWPPKKELLTGEQITLMDKPPAGQTWETYTRWLPKWCQEKRALNETPMVLMYELVRDRFPIAKLNGPQEISPKAE